jgi:hypothetical protein
MPDELIIAKLTLEDSGYLRAVDNMTAGTQKYIDAQHEANDELKKAQELLKNNQAYLDWLKTTKASAVEIAKAEDANNALIKSVQDAQAVYDKATKAAQDFFAASQKIQSIQNIPAPGNILQPPIPTPPAPPGGPPPIQPLTDLFSKQISDTLTNLPNIEDIFKGSANVKEVSDAIAVLNEELKLADVYLKSVGKDSDEFKTLKPAIDSAKQVLTLYNTALQTNTDKHVSLRTQILNLRNELVSLDEAGKSDTQEFISKQKEVAHLTRLYTEQQNRIHVLSSENRALDFGKSAIQAAVGAFQTFSSVSILAGNNQEELTKKTEKLFAAMSLLNGVEEISNTIKKGGVITTNLQSAAQATYTAVVGASTGALKALRIALLGTGILAVVAGIAFLIAKLKELQDAQEEANRVAKITNEVNEKAIDGYASQVSNLEVLKRSLNDLSTPQEERVRLAEAYNKTADQTNKIDTEQINNTDLLTSAINRQIDVIERRATATASQTVTDEKATTLFKARQKLKEVAPEFVVDEANIEKQIADVSAKAISDLQHNVLVDGNLIGSKELEIVQSLRSIKDANKDFVAAANLAAQLQPITLPQGPPRGSIEERRQELKKQIDDLTNVINLETNQFDTKLIANRREQLKKLNTELSQLEGTEGTTKIIENVFTKEVDKLNTELATLTNAQERSLETINTEFAEKLIQEKNRIDELLKGKQVTKAQAKILVDLSITINEAQKQKAIADLNKEVDDTKKKIQDAINNLQFKAQIDTANLIQEDFTRRATIIDINERRELQQNKVNLDEQLQQLKIDRQKKLISEEDYQISKNQFIEAGEQIANDIIVRTARERQQLSIDIFKQTLAQFENIIQTTNTEINTQAAIAIRNLSNQVLQGTLPIKQFQEQVNEIKKQAAAKSRNVDLQQKQAELFTLDHHLATMRDTTSKGYLELVQKRKELTDELTKLDAADAEADANDTKVTKKIEKVDEYAQAIGGLANAVIGFWTAANEAEERALDRSISLQQRRVDEAIRIADKGNASYLKAEQDRLKQLEVQRENAARRQLGIEAALQASNLLTGITGAIAKISSGVGAIEAIAEIATIVGLLATGYGLVKQLQANQPKFKEGTTYVERGGNRPGTDTVPAWLSEGEAVIPADKNQKYKKAVEAIYHEKIPAEDMNEFVYSYAKHPVRGFTHAQVENMFTKKVDVRRLDESGRLVYTLVNVAKRLMGQEHDKKFVSTLNAQELTMFSQVINSATNRHFAEHMSETAETFNIKKVVHNITNDLKKYQGFTTSLKDVPEADMERFISNYSSQKQLKTMTDLVNTYHTIKHAPIPNYQNMGAVTESKISSDSKMQFVMGEQNELLKQNNEHQKETHRLLKGMGISLKIDRDGVAAMVMKAIQEKKIYSKT